jgi:hypothetical protein
MTQIDASELRAIALRNYNRISPARSDDFHSYLRTVLMWLADWSAVKGVREDFTPGYCAFVLDPETVQGSIPEGAEERLCFKDDSTPLLGGSVYLTDYAINRVVCYPGKCRDLNEVVRMLAGKCISDLPFVAFDTDSQTVYVFEEGARGVTWQFALRVDLPRPFTIDVFEEMLGDVYLQHLKYPSGYPPIWHDAQRRVPCRDTELVIQSHVACILSARAQGSRASSSESEWLTVVEKKNNGGRVDIAVFRDQACVVVSEVKVLRHCHYPDPKKRTRRLATAQKSAPMAPIPVRAGLNEKWALHGARQAVRYRDADNAQSAALVLYDMRELDADLPTVRKQCAADGVRFLRYYLNNELRDKDS